MKLALFPLNTVLFPGSILPLQIFEQRYLSLITDCMKQETGFVSVLINEGREVGDTPSIYSTGCYVEIVDWDALAGNMLGINIEARHRVHLFASSVRDDGLLLAQAREIPALDPGLPLPGYAEPLAGTLKELLKHPFAARYRDRVDFSSATDICYRLGELLPIDNRQKQLLLESESIEQLLDQLAIHINTLQT
ncbi:MAG TPA: ATP-dependent protease [Gammaproteobacteria bacterium]|nr:ATP-dependent protease [Gammaproteobacteria bacterium]